MLGLLVSSRSNRSTTALMLLLFIWVVIVLAVPKVSMLVAGEVRDVPSVQDIQSQKDAAMAQIMAEGQESSRKFWTIHRREAMASPELREKIMAEYAKIQEAIFNDIKKEKDQIDKEYEGKKAAQFQLASRLSRISPASVYTYASTDLARTGFDRQARFLEAARVYQEGFVRYFSELMAKMIEQRGKKKGQEEAEKLTFDLDELPALDFREASFSESWGSAVVDLLILFLLFACFFMIAFFGFVRSDVR